MRNPVALQLLALLVLLPVLADTSHAFEAEWKLARAEQEVSPGSPVRETRWMLARPPAGPNDRIQLHRYRGDRVTHAALVYLPGTYMNGEAALTDARHNLWLHLAGRGVEVWALDYRTHFVPPAAGDHAFMRDWTLDRFVADAREAVAFARQVSGHEKVFVAGFSRGATIAFGVACTDTDVGGLVVLDGPFKRATPAPFDFEAARDELFASRFANDVAFGIGWGSRQRLMSAVAVDPQAKASSPEFASVGAELSQVLYGAWRPGGLADAVNGVSRVEVLAKLLGGYDRWWPAVQNVEGQSIASQDDDPRTPIDDAWGELSLPILYFGASNMGADWIRDGEYSAKASGSEDVELQVLEGYGHLDVLVGERAREEVYEPISAWIQDRSLPPAE